MSDLLWRIQWQVRRALLTVFGPAQLEGSQDPLTRLKKEREERYKNKG